jgi:hypothetical protein
MAHCTADGIGKRRFVRRGAWRAPNLTNNPVSFNGPFFETKRARATRPCAIDLRPSMRSGGSCIADRRVCRIGAEG